MAAAERELQLFVSRKPNPRIGDLFGKPSAEEERERERERDEDDGRPYSSVAYNRLSAVSWKTRLHAAATAVPARNGNEYNMTESVPRHNVFWRRFVKALFLVPHSFFVVVRCPPSSVVAFLLSFVHSEYL